MMPRIVLGQYVLEYKNVPPKRLYARSTSTERKSDGRSMWKVSGGRDIYRVLVGKSWKKENSWKTQALMGG
jgi:hypothetical protein